MVSTVGALFPLAAVERIFLGGYPRVDEPSTMLLWYGGNLTWGGAAYGAITGIVLARLLVSRPSIAGPPAPRTPDRPGRLARPGPSV